MTRLIESTPSRHPVQPTLRNGVRVEMRWRRANTAVFRDMGARELIAALQYVNTRAAQRATGKRDWTELDEATTAEAVAQSWGFGELQALALWSTPSWFSLLELPRRTAGFERFLALVVRAYRAGALGLFISWEEGMALCDAKSRATWGAWTKLLEQLRLIRIVQTWRKDASGRVVHGRLHYRIGPALEELAGAGLVENKAAAGQPTKAAHRAAVVLRRRAQKMRRESKAFAWQQCREGRTRHTVAAPVQPDIGDRHCQPVAAPPVDRPSSTSTVPSATPAGRAAAELDVDDGATLERAAGAGVVVVDGRGRATNGAPCSSNLGSSVTALHTASLTLGADTSAPERAKGLKGRTTSGRPTLSATPRPSTTTTPAPAARSSVAPSSTSSSAAARPAGVALGTVDVELGRSTDDAANTEPTRPPMALDGAPARRGLAELEQWLARTPRVGVRGDAAAELLRALKKTAPPCSSCGGAGGLYLAPKIGKSAKVPWAPERGVELGDWTECAACRGSGEA
jgi:hypothetical protein